MRKCPSIHEFTAPPAELSLWRWAEESIVLTDRQSTAFPGPYRTRITPYVRGIMDALDDAEIHTVVVQAGAQTGKTVTAYGWLARSVCCDPGPALVCYPSEDLARSNSQTRIQPLFEDSPSIARMIPADRKTYWQALQYRINGCNVHLTGANSPAQLSSRPIRYLLCDEIDKFPAEASKEADPVSLAIQRTKTFWNRKILLVSTPTTPSGQIARHAARGDMRRYYVHCHKCRSMQPLAWPQVKWDEGKPQTARYECVECGARWSDLQKRAAVDAGEWRATQTGEAGVASFHLSSLYAPWVSFADLASKFLRTKASPIELRDFINSDLAEPYIESDMRIREGVLVEREADYAEGAMYYRAEGLKTAVFGGVDVQQHEFVAVFRQFTETGDSALIFKGRLHTFGEIDTLATRFNAFGVCIDCRYRSQEVYEASLAFRGFWPVIGVPSFRVPALFEVQTRNIDEGKRGATGRIVTVMVANSNALLTMLAERVERSGDVPQWRLYRGATMDKQYVREMTSMYRANGVWVNPRKLADHYADAEKLCLLAADYAGYKRTITNSVVTDGETEVTPNDK
jgi:DNA-directed RNA polymerase subunit M/transcription elongation factor TFIIS